MNHKHISLHTDGTSRGKNGEYAVRRSYRSNIVAALICLLLAFVVWIFVMGREDTDYIATRIVNPNDAYTYTLSAGYLQAEGTVASLRHADYIDVKIPAYVRSAGTYRLTEADLSIPEGVHLTGSLDLILTVVKNDAG